MSDITAPVLEDAAQPHEPGAPTAGPARLAPGLTIEEAARALRALPFGGVDDSTASLALPPAVQATISPVVAAIRWGGVMFGLMFAAVAANAEGDLAAVSALGVVLFLTTWRTLRPIRLGALRLRHRLFAATDTLIVGAAVGASGGFSSPFIFCLLAAAAVGAFGWGLVTGLSLTALGSAVVLAAAQAAHQPLEGDRALAILASILLTVAIIAFARSRLLEAERKRAQLAGRLDMLAETNDLLHLLNQVARTLPTSLDLREAVRNAREQITSAFDAEVVALVVYDDLTAQWTPQITEGCALRPAATLDELPRSLADAVAAEHAMLVRGLQDTTIGVSSRSGSGIYAAVRAKDRTIGVLGVEHSDPLRYGPRDVRMMDGLSEVLALTVDNARSFSRLRTLSAEEERSRIARDLHDRLGQWLSYISFELERIIAGASDASPELDSLYQDVQTAIEELRETLRQLRSGVTEDKPFSLVAKELVQRFNTRSSASARFSATDEKARLGVPIENELLRILQEALSNVEKHAGANSVAVRWDVRDGRATLTIADDGKGFDTDRGVREDAYGLRGMRERAAAVDARLEVVSRPGEGTTILVHAGAKAPGAAALGPSNQPLHGRAAKSVAAAFTANAPREPSCDPHPSR
ncbi:MAG: histidine kinase [Acidimicrobiales bacterium]